jgi:hypothetical protein
MPQTKAHDLYRGMLSPEDPEFAAKVGSLVGYDGPPPYHVDPRVAKVGPNMNNLLGMYTDPNLPNAAYQKFEQDHGYKVEPGKVYGFGEPNETIWSHEYRHRNGLDDEYTNRLYDAAFAGSEKQWNFAKAGFKNFLSQVYGHAVEDMDVDSDLAFALEQAFPDKGNWRIWMNKKKGAMLSPDSPKAPPKRPVRSTKAKK